MKISVLSLSAAVAIPIAAADVTDATPGELASLLGDDTASITSLKVGGTIDVRDLLTISTLPQLKDLDLSGATIAAYTPDRPLPLSEGDFAADYLPAGIFFGKHFASVVLPESLTAIGSHALVGNDFATITLPEKLRSVGDYAFYDCDKLIAIILPASVADLGAYSFAGCDALASADLSASSLEKIADYAFRSDNLLADLKLPAGLGEVGTGAFAGCTALTSAMLPCSLDYIGEQAFTHSGLTGIVVPSSVSKVGDFGFARCDALEQATVEDGSLTLGQGVFFYDKALKEVKTDGIATVPAYTFAGAAALTHGENGILSDATEVGAYAFLDNKAEKLILSPALVSLADGALEGMTGLKEIDATALGDRVPELGSDVFAGINQPEVELIVAADTGKVWESAPQWKEFKVRQILGVGDTVADASSVKAWFEGRILRISSPYEIESVAVYLTGGAKAFHVEPYATTASVDTSDFSDRVYVVEVVTAEGRDVFKLLR